MQTHQNLFFWDEPALPPIQTLSASFQRSFCLGVIVLVEKMYKHQSNDRNKVPVGNLNCPQAAGHWGK